MTKADWLNSEFRPLDGDKRDTDALPNEPRRFRVYSREKAHVLQVCGFFWRAIVSARSGRCSGSAHSAAHSWCGFCGQTEYGHLYHSGRSMWRVGTVCQYFVVSLTSSVRSVPGVTVRLVSAENKRTVETTSTNDCGAYQFSDFPFGKYFIRAEKPTSYLFSQRPLDAPEIPPAIDGRSAVDRDSGLSHTFECRSASEHVINIGVYRCNRVGGARWCCLNCFLCSGVVDGAVVAGRRCQRIDSEKRC